MLLLVEFDINADIIDVPQTVIDSRELLRRQFIKWLYSPGVKKKHTKTINGNSGLCFRSEAFVEFLNKKVLQNSVQKAVIIQQEVPVNNEQNLPSVFF
jgi:hypothetical protein